jgi:type III pantothenate kinase
MYNLIVEIGNTAVKAAFTEGTTLGKTFRYQGEKAADFILSLTSKVKPDVLAIASVYEISRQDEKKYESACGKLLVLDQAHPEILRKAGMPDYLSYDRVASLVAVRNLFNGKSCTLMDFGTTFTIDFLNSDGSYAGGNISLGCRTRFKSLNRYSRSLPLIDTPEETPVVGHSFSESLASGVISGIMFEIEGYVSSFPGNIIVFTGGDANFFAKRMKNSIFVVCNLVLMGLALIADKYADEEID